MPLLAPAYPTFATRLRKCTSSSVRSCSTGLENCAACLRSKICSPASRCVQSRHTCCLVPRPQPRCLLTKRLHLPAAHPRCGNVGVCADLHGRMFSSGELVRIVLG